MDIDLTSVKVAILIDDGFQKDELIGPREFLKQSGATTLIVSPEKEQVRSWETSGWSDSFAVDVPLPHADEAGFDALLLPGGKTSIDRLKESDQAIWLVRSFAKGQKPIGAISHGPRLLVAAKCVSGHLLTSHSSLREEIEGAGGNWTDQKVVIDGNIVTSRGAEDIVAFNQTLAKLCLLHRERTGASIRTD